MPSRRFGGYSVGGRNVGVSRRHQSAGSNDEIWGCWSWGLGLGALGVLVVVGDALLRPVSSTAVATIGLIVVIVIGIGGVVAWTRSRPEPDRSRENVPLVDWPAPFAPRLADFLAGGPAPSSESAFYVARLWVDGEYVCEGDFHDLFMRGSMSVWAHGQDVVMTYDRDVVSLKLPDA